MKKIYAISLFLICFSVAVIMIIEYSSSKSISLEELIPSEKVFLSLKEKATSIIDSISNKSEDEEVVYQEETIINEKDDNANMVMEKIVFPSQEVIYNFKETTAEKIEQIIKTVTTPIKETTNGLAKQLIEWLLSLLSPEEIRELFDSEFGIDICN